MAILSHALSAEPPSAAPPLLEPLPPPETPLLLPELPPPLLDPLPELDVALSSPPEDDPEPPNEVPPLVDDEHPTTATTADPAITVTPEKASAMTKGLTEDLAGANRMIFMNGLV